jgi:LacI family transcriptional regulator
MSAEPKEQPPSIIEVAQRAGVSLATASRVLGQAKYPVSEPTRQRVLQAAAELNYVPNSLARSLKAQRSHLLAVIVGNNDDPYYAAIVRGVEEVANEQGYLAIVCNSDRNLAKEMHYLRILQDYRADGILFAGSGINDAAYATDVEPLVRQMIRRGAEVVTLTQHLLQVPSVQPDNFGGARQMTARLIALGHRRIAFIGGPTNLIVANVRLQGYMSALIEAGVAIDSNLILSSDFSQLGGEQATRALLQLRPEQRPTAIFAANDEAAYGVISALREASVRIPDEIAVCGFDDLPMSRLVGPSLTTVHIPLQELGRIGARRILALLNHEEVSPLEILPAQVIERDSTAMLFGYQIT